MANSEDNPWETETIYTSDVPISSSNHFLHATISGPLRTTSANTSSPLVIIIPGIAANSSEWVVVHRLASLHARTLLYDRSGLGLSTETSDPITAVSIAAELSTLLETTDLKGPYIIICHSYGGIIAREFLHLHPDSICGMVFVDANQELNTTKDPWPEPFIRAMADGLDVLAVTGVKEHHAFSAKEWQDVQCLDEEAEAKKARTFAAEFANYRQSGPVLAEKKQLTAVPPLLGEAPVSVLKGNTLREFQKIYAAGMARHNGTAEERRKFEEMLEGYDELDEAWQMGTMKLSRRSRFVRTSGEWTGHNVHFTEPDAIVEELVWVLLQIGKSQ